MRETSSRRCQNIINGYVGFVREKVDEGWRPYLLTFQFNPLKGSMSSRLHQEQNEIEQVYRKLISRVQRKPTTTTGSKYAPIFLCCPDRPVPKRIKKAVVSDVVINDGIHYHGISLLPPRSRIECLRDHFVADENRYLDKSRLTKIDAVRIETELESTCRYAFKGVKKGRFDYDDSFLVLPKTLNELF